MKLYSSLTLLHITALMTIKGQNISHFKLLLSAPPLIDGIQVSVKNYSYFIPVEHSSPICDGYYSHN